MYVCVHYTHTEYRIKPALNIVKCHFLYLFTLLNFINSTIKPWDIIVSIKLYMN